MAGATVTVEEVRKAQRATGPATVLAIGTATPANCVYQADYPDYYFRITKSDHLTGLKEKFKRVCKHAHGTSASLINYLDLLSLSMMMLPITSSIVYVIVISTYVRTHQARSWACRSATCTTPRSC